jgi:hypothetical protein
MSITPPLPPRRAIGFADLKRGVGRRNIQVAELGRVLLVRGGRLRIMTGRFTRYKVSLAWELTVLKRSSDISDDSR